MGSELTSFFHRSGSYPLHFLSAKVIAFQGDAWEII
jgi:hypothetical protein